MKKEKTIIIKKKVNPIATDANYERVVEVIGRANTALLADEMKAKKFSFGSANKRSQKKICFGFYNRGQNSGQASHNSGASKKTSFNWFEEFKISNPLSKIIKKVK
jgi:hypothetical protein